MADAKKPDDTENPGPVTRPDDAESELSDDQLDKIAGGLIQQRFSSLRIRPLTDT